MGDDIFFDFGRGGPVATYEGDGRYELTWGSHEFTVESFQAQSFIDWLLRTQDLGTPDQEDSPHGVLAGIRKWRGTRP